MTATTRAPRNAILLTLLLLVLAMASLGATSATSALAADDGSAWAHLDAETGEPRVDLYFGHTTSCPHCTTAKPFIAQLERELPWLVVHQMPLDVEGWEMNAIRIEKLAESIGEENPASVPIFLFGERLMTGFDDASTTGAQLRSALVEFHGRLDGDAVATGEGLVIEPETTIDLPLVGRVDASTISLPVLAVVLGGLDAVNPCALTVLFFLMSVLAGAGGRRRMLLVGGTFTAVSGIVYFVFMAAWLNLFMVLGALTWVTLVAGLAAVIAASINLKDYFAFGSGPSLRIPVRFQPAIFGKVMDLGEATSLRVILATAFVVAIVVNAYEALCTGGFPMVFTRVLTLSDISDLARYAYMALYCIIYVLPMIVMVLILTVTLTSRRVSIEEAKALKLLSGLLMLGFGLLLLFAPDMLTDATVSIGLLVGAITLWLLILGAGRLLRRRRGRPDADEA